MKLFIRNIILISIPLVVYMSVVVVIDPFDYLNVSHLINDTIKVPVANKIEPHMYKILAYRNNPQRNIVLGDSRSNEFYQFIDEPGWANLSYGGGSIREMIQTFWWVATNYQIDTVVMGLSIHLYNKCNQRFWVEETFARTGNVFSYAYNKYTYESLIMILKTRQDKSTLNQLNPMPFTRDEFWNYQIHVTSEKFMGKYIYPDNYLKDLEKISKFCDAQNIALLFWIPPSHIEFQKKILEYGLDEANRQFKKDLCRFGMVYDFDYPCSMTAKKENFADPLHFNDKFGKMIVDEVLHCKPHFARIKPRQTHE